MIREACPTNTSKPVILVPISFHSSNIREFLLGNVPNYFSISQRTYSYSATEKTTGVLRRSFSIEGLNICPSRYVVS